MLRRLALVLAILAPALLGSGLLRLAHDEVAHSRWAASRATCCSEGCGGASDAQGAQDRFPDPRHDPSRHGGNECPVCVLLASLASEAPRARAQVVATPDPVVCLVEMVGVRGSVGGVERAAARGPPSPL